MWFNHTFYNNTLIKWKYLASACMKMAELYADAEEPTMQTTSPYSCIILIYLNRVKWLIMNALNFNSQFYHFSCSGRSRFREQRHQKRNVVNIFDMRSDFFNSSRKFSLKMNNKLKSNSINKLNSFLTRLVRSKATGALCSVLSVTWLCDLDKFRSQQLPPTPDIKKGNFINLEYNFDVKLNFFTPNNVEQNTGTATAAGTTAAGTAATTSTPAATGTAFQRWTTAVTGTVNQMVALRWRSFDRYRTFLRMK